MNDLDLKFTKDGDLVLGEDGDFLITEGLECRKQFAHNIIKSISRDWFVDNVGADLEALYGLPVRLARREGIFKITAGLTKHDIFKRNNFYVDGRITDKNTIVYLVFLIEDNDVVASIEVELRLTGSININWGDVK